MAAIAHPSLTNSQQLGVRPWSGGRKGPARAVRGDAAALAPADPREAGAGQPRSDRELADFGATTADVYRELGHTVLARAAAVLGCRRPRNPRSIER